VEHQDLTGKNKEIDYRTLVFLGISLVSVGWILAIAVNFVFISILASGLCLMAIALVNREKWYGTNKKQKTDY